MSPAHKEEQGAWLGNGCETVRGCQAHTQTAQRTVQAKARGKPTLSLLQCFCFTCLTVLTFHFLLLTFYPQTGLFPQFKDLLLW